MRSARTVRSSEAVRARMQANLRWYPYEHRGYASGETVTIPYMTLVWLARLWGRGRCVSQRKEISFSVLLSNHRRRPSGSTTS